MLLNGAQIFCVPSFSLCCDKPPYEQQLKRVSTYFSSQFQGAIPHPREVKAATGRIYTHSQESPDCKCTMLLSQLSPFTESVVFTGDYHHPQRAAIPSSVCTVKIISRRHGQRTLSQVPKVILDSVKLTIHSDIHKLFVVGNFYLIISGPEFTVCY